MYWCLTWTGLYLSVEYYVTCAELYLEGKVIGPAH